MLRSRYREAFTCVVALCVLSLALGDLLRGVHLLAHAHVVCAEHGELVDAVPGSAVFHRNSDASAPAALADGAAAIAHHEHCTIAATPARVGRALPPSVLSVAIADGPSIVIAPPSAEGSVDRPILAFAPKQSPPV